MSNESNARKQREQDFHDKVFSEGGRESAGKFYSIAASSQRKYLDLILEHSRRGRILEYGCGPGSTAFSLAAEGRKVLGIDISPVAIENARKRAASMGYEELLEFQVMDAENLSVNDQSFEVVCGLGILHHLNLDSAFSEIARVLTHDGIAVFAEPLGHNPLINWYRKRTPQMRTEDEHPLKDIDLKRAGDYFDSVTTESYHFASLAAVPIRRAAVFPAVLRFLESVDRLIFKLFPRVRLHAWITVLTLAKPRLSGSSVT